MFRTILLMPLLAVLFAGCHTSGIWIADGKVHIEDRAFAKNLEITQKPLCTRTNEGFYCVQITVKNKNHTNYRIQYKFEWFDADGMRQTHALSPWREKNLDGGTEDELKAVSPLQGTEGFRLKIKRAE